MSDNQPPQGPWQQGPNPQQGPYQQGQPYPQQGPYQQQGWQPAGPPAGQPPRKRRLGLILGSVGAAVVVILAGGGVFAWQQLSGGGAQPAEALPDSTLAYARVDLDPSASQKVDIVRLLRKVPEFSEATGIDSDTADLRKALFKKATEASACSVDYEDDIEPWIGDRAAVAAVPNGDQPAPIFVLQSTDTDAAKKGIDKLAECGGPSTSAGVAVVGDYVVVAQEQSMADDVAKDAEKSPLSEDATFSSDMEALGDQGVASFWADGDGFAKLAGAMGQSSESMGQEFSSGAGAVRAGSDYIELASVVKGKNTIQTDKRSDVGNLPESTVLTASFAGGGQYVDQGWSAFTDAMGSMTYDFQSQLDTFELQTGISLPDDLKTVLGDNVTVAVDSRGLDTVMDSTSAPVFGDLGFGIKMTTDPDDAASLLDRVNEKLASQGAPELASKETRDGMVIATNDDYAADLAGDGSLGESDSFKTVVPAADNAIGIAYLDVDKVTDVAKDFATRQGAPTDDIEKFDPVQAVGVSIANGEDGRNTSLMRVSFN